MEIERKFLVETPLEGYETYPCEEIEQAYLCAEPVVRVRKKGTRYWLTCKGKGLLKREEFELPLDEKAYLHLLQKADGAVLTKVRYRIPLGVYTIELDVFSGKLSPLMLAEVEFPTEEEALRFTPPQWFGREVTFDPAYCNVNLSQAPDET